MVSAAAVAYCSLHVWTNQGQICEVHRGALAHAHKTTGLSPHRLPCRGNPGILLYTKDMMYATTDGALGAFAAGTQRHGWCSALLKRGLRGTAPIIRFQVTVYVISCKSRCHAICRSELA